MADIKVKSFSGSQIKTEFARPDLWKIIEKVDVEVKTSEGVLRYTMQPSFLTNMRSGSHVIDSIIPKFTGNNLYNLAILCHDFGYTRGKNGDHFVSRLVADTLLRDMVKVSGEINLFKRTLMYSALRVGGGSAYNEQNADSYGGLYANVADFMTFRWDIK